ncbi:hypothetical protein LTR85_012297 [Meristemomyces frigidus]|nr:hypothetical protein LTR85_012297 [Meristemomyces frigidus]
MEDYRPADSSFGRARRLCFLMFFKMAMKFLVVTSIFSLLVIKPVHDAYPDEEDAIYGNGTNYNHTSHELSWRQRPVGQQASVRSNHTVLFFPENLETDYLWMYIVFAYLYTTIAVYLVISTTRKIVEVRHDYLGTQVTVIDRTICLSGVPPIFQDEGWIKDLIAALDIGRVESVTLCRNWKELDNAIVHRMDVVQRLEEAYAVHLGYQSVEHDRVILPTSSPLPSRFEHRPKPVENHEDSRPLNVNGGPARAASSAYVELMSTTRFGWLRVYNRQVDAINYYKGKLREADDMVRELRKKTFSPTPLAFVTMDSVAVCQIAIQVLLDPSLLRLIATQSLPPSDIIWTDTYLPRRNRIFRS